MSLLVSMLVSLNTAHCAHVRSEREGAFGASLHPLARESNNDDGTRLGGMNHDSNTASTDWLESINNMMMDQEITPLTPAPRYGHCAAVVDGVMYMIGGAPLAGGLSGEVWAFLHGNASWKRLTPRGEGPQPIEGECMLESQHCWIEPLHELHVTIW